MSVSNILKTDLTCPKAALAIAVTIIAASAVALAVFADIHNFTTTLPGLKQWHITTVLGAGIVTTLSTLSWLLYNTFRSKKTLDPQDRPPTQPTIPASTIIATVDNPLVDALNVLPKVACTPRFQDRLSRLYDEGKLDQIQLPLLSYIAELHSNWFPLESIDPDFLGTCIPLALDIEDFELLTLLIRAEAKITPAQIDWLRSLQSRNWNDEFYCEAIYALVERGLFEREAADAIFTIQSLTLTPVDDAPPPLPPPPRSLDAPDESARTCYSSLGEAPALPPFFHGVAPARLILRDDPAPMAPLPALKKYLRVRYPDAPQFTTIEAFEAAGFPLHFAIQANDLKLFRLLLKEGANAKREGPCGRTPTALILSSGDFSQTKLEMLALLP